MTNKIHNNEFKLDLKDRKILYELDLDSRQPFLKLAKKVGLSTEVVNYRVKRLEENQIIKNYQIVVNLSKLNIIQFKICLSFQHINSKILSEKVELVKKIKEAKWIVTCNGNWDLLISMETYSLNEVELLKNNVLGIFENYVKNKSITICVQAYNYNRGYFIDNKAIKKKREIIQENIPIKLDEIDKKILQKLSQNARKSVVDLSIELKTSARIINYRIKQLQKNRIITGFKLMINYENMDLKFYKTFIYLDNHKKERVDSLISYFNTHPNIIHHVKVIGNWDLEPEFEVTSENEFNEVLKNIKDKFSDIIKNIDIITITEEHKFEYF